MGRSLNHLFAALLLASFGCTSIPFVDDDEMLYIDGEWSSSTATVFLAASAILLNFESDDSGRNVTVIFASVLRDSQDENIFQFLDYSNIDDVGFGDALGDFGLGDGNEEPAFFVAGKLVWEPDAFDGAPPPPMRRGTADHLELRVRDSNGDEFLAKVNGSFQAESF